MAPRRNIIPDAVGLSKRRGQVLSNATTRRVQGGQMVPWGSHNQFMGVPKDLQRGGAAQPPADLLGGRFAYGQNNNKIIDTQAGVYTPEQARQYQLLYNWAKANGVNIVGGKGTGGGYDPTVLYAQPNRYVDLRTGLANPPNTGASTENATAVSPEALARMQQKSGFDASLPQSTPAIGMGANGLSNFQLGSDGQYHDVNQATPPGVELKPPEGATAPLTQGVDQVAEAAHGTPQAALNAGKDPTKHIAYWESKGWTYNPASDQWTNRNAGTSTDGLPGPTGVQSPSTAPGGGGVANTMPLDPNYIAAQRLAQMNLDTSLGGVNPALEQIDAQKALAQARLATNEGYDKQALMESLAARGALDSSLYGTNLGNLATDYLRQNQDLAGNVASAYSGVYQQQQQAYNDYNQALIEALLASANSSATSPYTPVASTRRGNTKKGKKGKKGGNRG